MSSTVDNKNLVAATKVGGVRHKEHKKRDSPKHEPNNPPLNAFLNTQPQIIMSNNYDKKPSHKIGFDDPANKYPPPKNINNKNRIPHLIEQPKQGPW